MEKLVREKITLNEENKITKSYNTPMSRDELKSLIVKILIKFQKEGGKNITNMFNWLNINNFGNYQYNRWIKAVVDTLFTHVGGVWIPKNQNLTIDKLTDVAMNYWQNKFKKNDDIK